MDIKAIFNAETWAQVPFWFWVAVFFVFGCVVGSFLNVCIHRMPRGESLVSPPSHCPHCGYSIPWYLNIPLVTWLFLRGRCANCQASISPRYFVVELLTGILFAGALLMARSPALALVYCLLLAGLVVATFIDFEHFIIPDEITIGGIVVGFICSFAVPALHGQNAATPEALKRSFLGIVVGGGLVYLILRLGKLLFGKQRLELKPDTRVVFTESALILPDGEIPYEELFYRKSDMLQLEAKAVELIDRCYKSVSVRLTMDKLNIGDETLDPEQVHHMEVVTDQIVRPREAMGLGDVKFMAGIGAFLGWKATIFSLMLSSIIGALVGLALIVLKRQEWSSRLPYGPYIALAAVIWIFGGNRFMDWWLSGAWAR